MTQHQRQQIETMKQSLPPTEEATQPAGPCTDLDLCTDMDPCADLEPTTKTVPRKSDEPIERGSKNYPQTSTQDANKP